MRRSAAGYFVGVICNGVKGQEELGWLSLVELRVWVRTSAALVGLSGGDGNSQVIFLACLVGREAALGENTFGVLTTLSRL